MTSSNQASNEVIKNLRLSLSQKRCIFSGFYGYSQQTIINLNVDSPWTLQYHYQIVRKLSIKSNWLTLSLPEVKVINVKLVFSNESTHNCWCFVCNLILFIMPRITWQNDYKNLPVVPWSFFCELLLYVTYDTLNWSLESTDLKNNHFEANWWSDRKLELICQ